MTAPLRLLMAANVVAPLLGVLNAAPQPAPVAATEVTFTKHVAPILQRSCENCHRPDGVAPMALRTYEEVRPWARAIKQRTGMGPRAGVMPPWYVEKNIGIQHFKNDPSLSKDEIALVAKWADTGAPRGDLADLPPPRVWNDAHEVVDRHARSRRAHDRRGGQGNGPIGGARFPRAPSGSPRIATFPPSRSRK